MDGFTQDPVAFCFYLLDRRRAVFQYSNLLNDQLDRGTSVPFHEGHAIDAAGLVYLGFSGNSDHEACETLSAGIENMA